MRGVVVSFALLLVAGAALARPAAPRRDAAAEEFFERRVRPVLANRCGSCHGAVQQMGGLRVDSRAALLKGGSHGPALTPGDPEQSRLLQAVRHAGALKMPPAGKIPDAEIADLTRWVQMGAPWETANSKFRISNSGNSKFENRHSKLPWSFQPVRMPAVSVVRGAASPVDAFVGAKLAARGLKLSRLADRRTLIRRATFDLIGLPPTPAEVDAFLEDRSPDAWAKVIDRLLASPHYGERWGRYWLDVARYADTKGYVFFQDGRFPWAYTYRDYVIRAFNEDLPYDRFIVEQLAADRLPLGEDRRPLTALGFLTLGGRFMNNQQDILDDRIDVTTRGLLGLTVSCARCHDHKFDPVSAKDYYSLYGVFASSVEPEVPPLFLPVPQTEGYAAFERELKVREQKLAEFVRAKQAEVARGARTRAGEYLLAAHAVRDQPAMDDFMLIADGGDLNPKMLHRWQGYLQRTRRSQHPVLALWHALSDLPEKEFEAKAPAVLARLAGEKSPPRRLNLLVAKAFTEKPPKSIAEAAQRYGELLAGVADAAQALADPAREELRQVLYGADSPAVLPPDAVNDLALLPDRASQAKLQELRGAVEKWRATGPEAPPRAMALEDAPEPAEPYVFVRGNPNNRGESVPRQFLSALSGPQRKPFREGSGRLELARAIADPKNPLTARVLVNRVWLHHFGAGLVATPSDFGMRSEPPTHPELLDWLAATFVQDGWSIKKLHRRIMLSQTYQQASDPRPELARLDPENRLLGRMNRRRLDFEALRDSLLAVAGTLDRTPGGPSVDLMGSSRRTVYGFLDRLNLPGLLRTFDFPSPDATSPQRDLTTVPQQALFMMNHPFVGGAAQKLLQRPEIAAEADPARRVTLLYRLAYGRVPDAEERALAAEYLGATPAPAAWERYVQALLEANEFVFVD